MSASLDKLKAAGLITAAAAARLEPIAERYSIAVPPDMVDAIRHDPAGPIARQYMPDVRELENGSGDRPDPIGDAAHSPVKGIVHRYPNRVLLMPLETCAVYCRFCFRREKVGRDGHGLLPENDLAIALDYIRTHDAVREVILTGGDPLILSERRLRGILEALDGIAHVKIVRVHTRLPVADPARLTDALYACFAACRKPLYVVIHVNHADELNEAADAAFTRLRRSGCILLSQSVLLKDVNDSVEALATLFQALVEHGVKPYYLHHPDLAPGTGHFRLPPETGQRLMRSLRGRISGLAVPTYVLDVPGGHGKVPLTPCHLEKDPAGGYTVIDIHGRIHAYDPGLESQA